MTRWRHLTSLLLASVLGPGSLGAVAEAPRPPRVSGQVLDASGTGLAGARIELLPLLNSYRSGRLLLDGRLDSEALRVTTSTAGGAFRISSPSPGLYRLRVEAAGHVPMQLPALALAGKIELPPVSLPRDRRADLRLLDADGKPLSGWWVVADVTGTSRPGGWVTDFRRARTGADGSVRIPAAARERLRVSVFRPGVWEETLLAVDGPLRLKNTRRWRGIAVRDEDGQPVPNVLVRVGALASPIGVTSADGNLPVALSGEDVQDVLLMTADGRRLAVRLDARREDVETLVLPEPRVFSGRVLDAVSRAPIPEALVWSTLEPGLAVRTDSRGVYRLTVPDGDPFELRGIAPGYLLQATDVGRAHLAASKAPAMALPRPITLPGTVRAATDLDLAGCSIEATIANRRLPSTSWPASVRTISDSEGRFELDGLRPGATYVLKASRRESWRHRSTFTAPRPGQTAPLLSVRLTQTRRAHGRILGPDEAAIEGAAVTLRSGGEVWQGRSGGDGRFAIEGVPARDLDLTVHRRSFAPLRLRGVKIPEGSDSLDLGVLRLEPGALATGRAVRTNGDPVSGAEIYVLRSLEPPAQLNDQRLARRPPDATSDAEGLFIVEDLPRGEPVSLYIRQAGHIGAWIRGVEAPTPEPLTVVLETNHSLVGEVLDTAGHPIPGAEVSSTWQRRLEGTERPHDVGPPIVRSVSTDSAGRFELLGARPPQVRLDVTAAGFVELEGQEVTIPASGEIEPLTLILDRGAILEGRVLTRAGEPVAGAQVMAGSHLASTDPDGAFHLAGLALGRATLQIQHPDFPAAERELEIALGINPCEVVLEDGVAVSGRVLAESESPLAGASLRLTPLHAGGPRPYRGLSDADGTFRLAPVAPGHYRLEAAKPGFARAELSEPLTVESGPVDGVEISLFPGATVQGQVLGLDPGELARVRLIATDEAGRSYRGQVDHTGKYRVADLGPGSWTLLASLDGGRRQARSRIFLEPGQRRSVRDLEFGGDLVLSGQVSFYGEPLRAARISLRGVHLESERSTTTNYLGEFRFDDLITGAYALGLSHSLESLVHNQSLHLTADRHLDLHLGASRVAGRVSDRHHDPVQDALITLRRRADGGGALEFLITGGSGEDGRFELPRVPAGRYLVESRKDGFAPHRTEVEIFAGSDLLDLEIVIERTRGLDLQVRLADGRHPPYIHLQVRNPSSGNVMLSESRPLDGEGRASLATLPGGTWHLWVSAPGGALARQAVTAPGESLALTLPPAGDLGVTIPELRDSDRLAELILTYGKGRRFQSLEAGGSLVERWQVRAGRILIDDVATGSLQLDVTTFDGRRWSLPVEIVAGAATEIELR